MMHNFKVGETYRGTYRRDRRRLITRVVGDKITYKTLDSLDVHVIRATNAGAVEEYLSNRTHDSDGNPVSNQQENAMSENRHELKVGQIYGGGGYTRRILAKDGEKWIYWRWPGDNSLAMELHHSEEEGLQYCLGRLTHDEHGEPVKPANPLARELLLSGAEGWNRARDYNPDLVPNFAGADLSRLDLKDRNLVGANLSGANLSRSILSGCNFSEADLSNANLEHAILERTIMCQATIDGARVKPADIGGPGHILYALTEEEAAHVKRFRI